MRKTLASLAALAAFGLARESRAQGTILVPGSNDNVTNVATRGANWLNIGVGARAQALGGAAIATLDGPAALFWNPANIATREGISAFASYTQLYANSGITSTAGGVTLPALGGTVGLGVQQFSSGEMERTTERAPGGGDPVFGGTFSYTGLAVSAHYARNVTDRLTAGLGIRFAQEGIDVARSSFVGADISTRFRTGLYGLSIGGSIQNIGNTSKFGGAGVDRAINAPRDNGNATGRQIPVSFTTREVQMPTTFRFGLLSSIIGDAESLMGANDMHSLTVEGAFARGTDGAFQPAVGTEYTFKHAFSARAGKRFFNENDAPWKFRDGLSFGGGVRVPINNRLLQFDYAYVTMGELQHNQVLSFDVAF